MRGHLVTSEPAGKLDETDKRKRAELADRISYLQDLQKSYDDPGQAARSARLACPRDVRCQNS